MISYAYYNENDPYAAQWLRNLIAKDLITPGYVDERNIQDVQINDLQGFFQHHFFAGIGVWSHSLRQCGWPDDRPVVTGSCPCQPFSVAGNGIGLADPRHLWPDFFRLLRQIRPQLVLGEQVASPAGLAWFDAISSDLENENYSVGAVDLCAASVGAPHIRQKLYWMGYSRKPRSGRNTGTISRSEKTSKSSRSRARNLSHESISASPTHPLANPYQDGFDRTSPLLQSRTTRQEDPDATRSCPSDRMADTNVRSSRQIGPSPSKRPVEKKNGFHFTNLWKKPEWIACQDGLKRPTQPGLHPLAHGIANRVGRLRAYGNALCTPQAQAFITAVMAIVNEEKDR